MREQEKSLSAAGIAAKINVDRQNMVGTAVKAMANAEQAASHLHSTNRREQAEIDQKKFWAEREHENEQARHVNLQVQTELALSTLMPAMSGSLGVLSAQINRWMNYQGFWASRNVGEKLALMHSEISEAMEADRKQLPSDHIGGFSGVEEEMADVVIRVLDFCYENDLRLAAAIEAKMRFNLQRPHMHGKKY